MIDGSQRDGQKNPFPVRLTQIALGEKHAYRTGASVGLALGDEKFMFGEDGGESYVALSQFVKMQKFAVKKLREES